MPASIKMHPKILLNDIYSFNINQPPITANNASRLRIIEAEAAGASFWPAT
jgi:hypothetical protein